MALNYEQKNLATKEPLLTEKSPDAFSRLLLEAFRNKSSNFVRDDEIKESWRIFTPIISEVEKGVKSSIYKAGSAGPAEALKMLAEFGFDKDCSM